MTFFAREGYEMVSLGLEHINWDEVDETIVGKNISQAVGENISQAIKLSEAPNPATEHARKGIIAVEPVTFEPDWPEPAPHLFASERPKPPALNLEQLLPPSLAEWVEASAESKGAPVDYVFAALLSAAGSAIGTSRWASPRKGWVEPPIIWTMLVGNPSAGKSPAIDAIQGPLSLIERAQRKAAKKELAAWEEKAIVADAAEKIWKKAVSAAAIEGEDAPPRPESANVSEQPHVPRLIINDGTIERIADILSRQPRGTLQIRDELSGWLEGMSRYSSGSDRPFWLESYGGRSFTVERMSRPPVTVQNLAVSVVGGIQPDRLQSLLFATDDDGLLARFIPIWPEPAPITRPTRYADDEIVEAVFKRLYCLHLSIAEDGEPVRLTVPFSSDAEVELESFRRDMREEENSAEGLMLSFLGKLPGLAVRLSLVLRCLHCAVAGDAEPYQIDASCFDRARSFVLQYCIPMARRAYAEASKSELDMRAEALISLVRKEGWQTFATREVMRLGKTGLSKAADLNPVLTALEDWGAIRQLVSPVQSCGRPSRSYAVNPALLA